MKKYHKTHGMWGSRFYHRYYNIVSRCNNKNFTGYDLYGGRGILCEWSSFDEFKRDMYESYKEHVLKYGEKRTLIERIDNNKNYSKTNCCWTTPYVQARNKRSTRLFTYKGETKCVRDWERVFGFKRSTITNRLRLGYSFEEAIIP